MSSLSGSVTMDTVDLWDTYGIFAVRGSLNELMKLPDLKEPSSYSWETENGDDVMLTNRKTADRDVSLTFLQKGSSISDLFTKRDLFVAALAADGYRVFNFAALGKSFNMFYKGCDSAEFYNTNRVKMVLKFRLNV